jgi:RnfABCDGE-type electron transport complex G subunit
MHDNDLMADAITWRRSKSLGLDDETRLWRARKERRPGGAGVRSRAPDGYSGRIGLIVAVGADGRLLAVRVTAHKETPGLGDYIDPKKDRNKARPWITQFNGLGFDSVPRDKWRVKKDGGRFDQMSGATISARAVTNASGRALAWAVENRDKPVRPPARRPFRAKGKTMSIYKDIAWNGLWKQNTILAQLLGLCPLLAVSTTLVNAVSLGLATILVMMLANLAMSALRALIPYEIRIPVFILIIAALVTVVDLAFNAFLHDLYLVLGIFIPLIVTNCIVLARVEAFAAKNGLRARRYDGLMMGVGWCLGDRPARRRARAASARARCSRASR